MATSLVSRSVPIWRRDVKTGALEEVTELKESAELLSFLPILKKERAQLTG